MAKYDITHTCGHVVTHDLFGPSASRDRNRAWLRSNPCKACALQAANAEAANRAEAAGLPALTGSEKQIAWATSIRDKAIASVNEKLSRMSDPVRAGSNPTTYTHSEIIDALTRQTEAKWWIDRRNNISSEWMTNALGIA